MCHVRADSRPVPAARYGRRVARIDGKPIAEYLIGSLNDRGYLPVRPSEVTVELDVLEDRVKAVIGGLQAQEPVGIGMRNLRECLLLQLERLAEQGLVQPMQVKSLIVDEVLHDAWQWRPAVPIPHLRSELWTLTAMSRCRV